MNWAVRLLFHQDSQRHKTSPECRSITTTQSFSLDGWNESCRARSKIKGIPLIEEGVSRVRILLIL